MLSPIIDERTVGVANAVCVGIDAQCFIGLLALYNTLEVTKPFFKIL